MISVGVLFVYRLQVSHSRELLTRKEILKVKSEVDNLNSFYSPLIGNVDYLSEQSVIEQFLIDRSTKLQAKEKLETIIRAVRGYDQIRLLNVEGKEVLRIDIENDKVINTPDSLLQDKSDRAYFQDLLNLEKQQIYIGPIDLNVEFGEIEKPIKPVVRVAKKVISNNDSLLGFIITNYLNMLDHSKFLSSEYSIGEVMILNDEGYWLYGSEAYPTFGHLLGNKETDRFQSFFTDEWKTIQSSSEGVFETDNGLFTYQKYMGLDNSDQQSEKMFIVSHVAPNLVAELSGENVEGLILTLVLICLGLLILTYILAKSRYETITHRIKLENANEKLTLAFKELESFSYSISHDLRAPLRAINGYAEILEEDYAEKIDDSGKRVLNIIRSNAIRMGRLIDDLLQFSRLNRKAIEQTQIDMSKLTNEILEEMEAGGEMGNCEIEHLALPMARGDRTLIKQVLINLISNAIKYSSHAENPKVTIGWKQHEERVVYFVKDNGVGFDMQYADKLFGVFQRLHSDEEFEGTGIGLAIVSRIVIRHGGKIWAEAIPEKGATFFFYL